LHHSVELIPAQVLARQRNKVKNVDYLDSLRVLFENLLKIGLYHYLIEQLEIGVVDYLAIIRVNLGLVGEICGFV
jgi:hypothetical protein